MSSFSLVRAYWPSAVLFLLMVSELSLSFNEGMNMTESDWVQVSWDYQSQTSPTAHESNASTTGALPIKLSPSLHGLSHNNIRYLADYSRYKGPWTTNCGNAAQSCIIRAVAIRFEVGVHVVLKSACTRVVQFY